MILNFIIYLPKQTADSKPWRALNNWVILLKRLLSFFLLLLLKSLYNFSVLAWDLKCAEDKMRHPIYNKDRQHGCKSFVFFYNNFYPIHILSIKLKYSSCSAITINIYKNLYFFFSFKLPKTFSKNIFHLTIEKTPLLNMCL